MGQYGRIMSIHWGFSLEGLKSSEFPEVVTFGNQAQWDSRGESAGGEFFQTRLGDLEAAQNPGCSDGQEKSREHFNRLERFWVGEGRKGSQSLRD